MRLDKLNSKPNFFNLIFLTTFGTAFGFVEAAVVYYLRDLMNFHANYAISNYKVLLNIGFITFVAPIHALIINNRVTSIEVVRETATIIMLISVAYIAGSNKRQRLGAFLVSFACWDIMYYVFLKILDNWPSSLLTKDIFFLIPVTLIGPVITPLIISACLLIIGSRLYLTPKT
ncbi:MAG TPA: hypothetical protein VMR18_00050 [Candidatus Saccharimonadales bacterium]|jgi:hypothetical protein|nr:hypothetical protein [Candidatus Saccharimonadales bacterium]